MEKEERNKKRRIRMEEEESERLKKKKEEECEKQQNEKEEMEKEEHNERWRLRMEREERDRLKKEKEEEIEKQQNEQKKMEKEERNERWRLRVEKEERDRLKKEKEVEKESLENEETFSRTINVGDLISFSEIPGYSDFLFEIFRVLEVNRDIAAFLVANRKKHIWFSKEDFSYDQIKFTKQKKGCSSHNCVLSNAEFQMSNSIEEDHVRRALSKVYCDVIRFGTTLIKSSDVFNFLCKKDNKVVVKVEKVDVEMKQIYVSQGDKSNWIDFSDGLYSKVCYFRSRSTVTRCRNLSEYTFHQKIQDKFAHPILYSSLNSILESTWMLDKPYLRVNDWKLKISDIKSEMVNFNICNAWTTRIMKPLGSYEAYVSKLDQYFEDIKFCSNYLLFSFKAMAFLSLITKMPSEIKHNIQFCESVIEVHNHIDDYGFEEIKSELKNGIITYQGVLQRAKKDDKARIEAINNVLIFMGDVVNVVMSGKVEFISWLNIQLEFESKFAYKYSRLDYTSRRRRLGINQKQHMQTFLKIDMVEEIRHDKSRACTEIFQRIAVDPTDMETIVSNAVEDFYRKIYRLYHSDYVHVWEIEGDNTLHNYYGYIDLAQERIRVIVAGNYYCLSERNTYVAKTMEIKVHQLFHLHCGPHIPLWKYSV